MGSSASASLELSSKDSEAHTFEPEGDDEDDEKKPEKVLAKLISFRQPGIVHNRNEVLLDVIDELEMRIGLGQAPHVYTCSLVTKLIMNPFLSGMPLVKLGLNDTEMMKHRDTSTQSSLLPKTVSMDDVQFHGCVNVAQWESDRKIQFIPPNEKFELLRFTSRRLDPDSGPWFVVTCYEWDVSGAPDRIGLLVKIRSNLKRSSACQVSFEIPAPFAVEKVGRIRTSSGKASMVGNFLVKWTMHSFAGGKEHQIKGQFRREGSSMGFVAVEEEEKRMDEAHAFVARDKETDVAIKAKFEVLHSNMSGMVVRYLNVIEASGYQAFPWVHYVVRATDYVIVKD